MQKKLIVIVPSYNNGEYLGMALQSILMQKVNFDMGIIVAEDASTDQSIAILKNYEEMYPDKIQVLYSEANQGLMRNIKRVYPILDSDYFCVLDADDYWIDPNFLQKAVDFLDNHIDFSCYSSDTILLTEDGKQSKFCFPNTDTYITNSIYDYIQGSACIPHTSGSVYRNVIYRKRIPAVVQNAEGTFSEQSFRADHSRFVMHLKHGKAFFKNEFVGVYRWNGKGIFTSANDLHRDLLSAQVKLDLSKYYDDLLLAEFNQLFISSFDKVRNDMEVMIREHQEIDERDKIHIKELQAIYQKLNYPKEVETNDLLQRKLDAICLQNRKQDEILWANIFHDTINGSKWLSKDTSMSPGRWALGYPALYVLYRVLDEVKPASVLELGLGQSTKIIGQYAQWQKKNDNEVSHCVVEHDSNWINFFSQNNDVLNTEIVLMDLEEIEVDFEDVGKTNINCYMGFGEYFEDRKFNFILIDAPLGSKEYSRVDILSILPHCLEEEFVIIMDDCNRCGEYRTLTLIEDVLRDCQIEYCKGIYEGEKTTILLASKGLEFLASM